MPLVDLHSHILPGVDDGPETLEGTLAFARAAVAGGTSQIVATPHVDRHHYIEPEAIGPAVDDLNEALAARGVALTVHAGAEVAIPRLLDLDDGQLASLTLGDGHYLLLECPFQQLAGDLDTLVFGAQARGFGVVLAHPERSPVFLRNPAGLRRLVESGVLVQLTASAVTGDFGGRVREYSLALLRDDLVHVVASDAHDHGRRPPDLTSWIAAAAREVPGIEARAGWLCEDVPAAILAGEDPPAPPPRPAAAARGGWLRRVARVR